MFHVTCNVLSIDETSENMDITDNTYTINAAISFADYLFHRNSL